MRKRRSSDNASSGQISIMQLCGANFAFTFRARSTFDFRIARILGQCSGLPGSQTVGALARSMNGIGRHRRLDTRHRDPGPIRSGQTSCGKQVHEANFTIFFFFKFRAALNLRLRVHRCNEETVERMEKWLCEDGYMHAPRSRQCLFRLSPNH